MKISRTAPASDPILIRNLPAGTKAALRARAEQRHRSVEAWAASVPLADRFVTAATVAEIERDVSA